MYYHESVTKQDKYVGRAVYVSILVHSHVQVKRYLCSDVLLSACTNGGTCKCTICTKTFMHFVTNEELHPALCVESADEIADENPPPFLRADLLFCDAFIVVH